MGILCKRQKEENVPPIFAERKAVHGEMQRRPASARGAVVRGILAYLFAALTVQVISQPGERCAIEDLSVEVESTSISPLDNRVAINVGVEYASVVPSEARNFVVLEHSCRSAGNVGTTSKLIPSSAGRLRFKCVVQVDVLCSSNNVVVTTTAKVPDNEFSLGCEQFAQATTTVCGVDGSGGLPSSTPREPCPIDTLHIATPTVGRDAKSLYDLTVGVGVQLVTTTALDEFLHRIKLKNYCLFNDEPGKITPATLVGHGIQFECTVWTEFPFDCSGNLLDFGVEAYVTGTAGIPVDGCAVKKTMKLAICLDRSTGKGVAREPGGVMLQQPQLGRSFPPPLECQTELPSIDLLQVQGDPGNQFKATLDVASEFSGTRHGLVEALHFCSINGKPGLVENHPGHSGESLFSCTVETTWPFHCGSNFIEFWTQVIDRRQIPPCVKNAGKRFSYCLDSRTRATHVLGLQAIQFPTVRDTSFFGILLDGNRLGATAQSNQGAAVATCPSTTLHVEVGEGRLNSTQDVQSFVLGLVVYAPEASALTTTCTLNGIPGVTSQPALAQGGFSFTCTVSPRFPSACQGNMVDVFVETTPRSGVVATCKQRGSVRVSLCLNPLLSGVRIVEILDVPESLFGRSRFPHLSDANPWELHTETGKGHYESGRFGYRRRENAQWKDFGADWDWGSTRGQARNAFQKGVYRRKPLDSKWHGFSDPKSKHFHDNSRDESLWGYRQDGAFSTIPDCAFEEGGLDITIQQVQRDPADKNMVILDIVLLRQEIDVKTPTPRFECSLNGHRGTLTDPTRTGVGFSYVCTVLSLNPFQCGSNEIVVTGESIEKGELPAKCSPHKRKVYTFCLDSKTEEAKISETSEEHSSGHPNKLKSKRWGVRDSRGWSSDQGCAVRGEVAVDLLGSVWDGRSNRATLRLLIRYDQGAEPNRIIQDELTDIRYIHVEIHEKTLSSRYESYTQFVGPRTQRAFFAGRNAACDRRAGRLVSLCVNSETQRALILTSKLVQFDENSKRNTCLVSELDTEITKVEEKRQTEFLPLLTVSISVKYAFRQTKHREWHDIHIDGLDPIRDVKCACQSKGVRGATGGITAMPNGFKFTCTVPLRDNFNCLTSEIKSMIYLSEDFARVAGGHECSKTYSLMSTTYCMQPTCRFYAVDMGYSGQFGLVTDAPTARILLLCSHPVEVCKDCFVVTGPQFASVNHLQLGNDGLTTYYLYFSWEDTYRGPVSVSVESVRSRQGCSLELPGAASVSATHPECTREKITRVGPVKDLRFNVVNRGQVLVKTMGYETKNGCGDRC
ncbi:hypothetical protein BSKO_10703 [Bryopsis sp. KO-2023]|nr:hypothetical protein BSKO_10703 [Bryopsis sp. KO-2023]